MYGRSLLVVAAALVAVTSAWPGYDGDDEYSSWRLARSQRRSHHCVGSGSKCYSTAECCGGYVCAAFDDYFGQRGHRSEGGANPEIPGFCVKEKDFQPCYSTSQCEPQHACISLNRGGEKYCVRRPEPKNVQDLLDELPVINVPSANRYLEKGGSTGLGGKCSSSSDCKPYDKEGRELCCQKVKRGRMAAKVICDPVTLISNCIKG